MLSCLIITSKDTERYGSGVAQSNDRRERPVPAAVFI
nr:MAG TPA: hypothetical protein [Bacteriophage sp.]